MELAHIPSMGKIFSCLSTACLHPSPSPMDVAQVVSSVARHSYLGIRKDRKDTGY